MTQPTPSDASQHGPDETTYQHLAAALAERGYASRFVDLDDDNFAVEIDGPTETAPNYSVFASWMDENLPADWYVVQGIYDPTVGYHDHTDYARFTRLNLALAAPIFSLAEGASAVLAEALGLRTPRGQ